MAFELDTQIGDQLYIVLEDGKSISVTADAELDEVLIDMPGHAYLIALGDAVRLHKALGAVLAGNADFFWLDEPWPMPERA